VEIRSISVQGQPGQKFHKTSSQPMTGSSGYYPSYMINVEILSIMILCVFFKDIKQDPISKITKTKKAREHGSSGRMPA
jgi:hypothetical protein